MKLYREVLLQGFFYAKLRKLAEKLHDSPLTLATITQDNKYISELFKPNVAPADLLVYATKQFESIFQDLASSHNAQFLTLLRLFFLKPFPFEVRISAEYIAFNSCTYSIPTAAILTSNTALDCQEERKNRDEAQALIAKHASYVKSAFEAIEETAEIIKTVHGFQIIEEGNISSEFGNIIKIENIGMLNPIFHRYFIAVRTQKFQKDDFFDVFEESFLSEKVQDIIADTIQKLDPITDIPEIVLSPPDISLRSRYHAIKDMTKDGVSFDVCTLTAVQPGSIQYEVHHVQNLELRRRLICCHPRDRETYSALLNANPLVKALLLSQVPLAVVLQILRIDNYFKDVSTVMWCEPILATIGFACGVYALRNPQRLANAPVRILEALSASSVVLTKGLGIAILAHIELFPEEGNPGGIDIERFLKVVASGPITIAVLFWVYNSINPVFKANHFSKRARFMVELINNFSIYFGLNQIISIDIVKIMNRSKSTELSTHFNRMLFELLPAIPAIFFAYARVAPIRACRRDNVYVNISETINTIVLYGFTSVLLTNVGIDLVLGDNLPTAQTNFRRVFFPGLLLAASAVMARFARSFPLLYDGNPEVIVKQVIRDRNLEHTQDGNFRFGGASLPLLGDQGDLNENLGKFGPKHGRQTIEALEKEIQTRRPQQMVLPMWAHLKQQTNSSNSAHTSGPRRCCSCVLL